MGMEYHEIRLLLDRTAVKLIRAHNASLILGFFYKAFKDERRPAVSEGQLRAILEAYLEERRDQEPGAYPKSAADYLADWCSDAQAYLRKYYGPDSDEPLFELTSGCEKALLWLESLRDTRFVGTESRLHRIFSGLDEILKFASDDPEKRIERLTAEIAERQQELDKIRSTGQVTATFTPVQINERYAGLLAAARELLGDFRQVEENFKRIAREVASRQTEPGITKGHLVAHVLDSNDALRESEQGQSFFAFWELLLSLDKQARFQEQVEEVLSLPALDQPNRADSILRDLLGHLLREGEQVSRSHQRMSASLRRVLDTAHLAERRRLAQLLSEITHYALQAAASPPVESSFFEVEDSPEIFGSLDRSPWPEPLSVDLSAQIAVEDQTLSPEDLQTFRDLPQLRLQELRRRVGNCVGQEEVVSLRRILELFPPRNGIMEVIGYLLIATDDPRHYVGEDGEEMEVIEIYPGPRRWRVPYVLFGR